MKFLIIHGIEGYPTENWFGWLTDKLEALGHEVICPHFLGDEFEGWRTKFLEIADEIDNETIWIAHSMGAPFALNMLEEFGAKKCHLVGGFGTMPDNKFAPRMVSFVKDFNWANIKANCSDFTIWHSDNDPYVDINKAHELVDNLGGNLHLVSGAGHFNSASDYNTFDLLLDDLTQTPSES